MKNKKKKKLDRFPICWNAKSASVQCVCDALIDKLEMGLLFIFR